MTWPAITGALTLVFLALFALSVGWWLVDWLSGGREGRRRERDARSR